ncbi:MAG: hypothetical protein KGZ58_00120 [Ignavibacteriales bacterium]|nr:hypothetical protein [Ignavibacteriales bacterium]
MTEIVRSKNNIPIRLTEERWIHITEEHSEMAGYFFDVLETIENPVIIFEGKHDEKIAVKEIEKGKFLLVFYKEIQRDDGFIITAFFTRQKKQLEKRKILWSQQK